jgi:hypothetical protein
VDEQQRKQQASRREARRLLQDTLGGQGETELALLDPLGRSPYRWNEFGRGYFATVDKHTLAILDRDSSRSGLYRSRLCTRPPGQPMDHHWVEEQWLPLRQQIALLQEATRSIRHEHLSGKEAPWLSRPASTNQLQILGRFNAPLPEQACAVGWTQGEASAAITSYLWRWPLSHPPPLHENRRTRDETLPKGHAGRGTP